MSLLLDTDRLDSSVRAEALQSVLTSVTGGHDLRLLDAPDKVHARLEYWRLNPAVTVLHQVSSGVSHTRTERHTRHDGPDRVVFVLHSGGPGSYMHSGRRHPLRHGGLYVTDLSSCYSYTRPGEGAARIVQVERSALGLTVEQVDNASIHLWESPFYDLLRTHIANLAEVAPTLAGGQSAALAAVTTQLTGALLRTNTSTEMAASPELGAMDFLVERTMAFLAANFRRPDLTAATIAHENGVSPRHLYRRWSNQPKSLTDTLRDIRLNAAHELLISKPVLPIGVIAHRCGFVDPTHFSRLFHDRFGYSPRQFRLEKIGPTAACNGRL